MVGPLLVPGELVQPMHLALLIHKQFFLFFLYLFTCLCVIVWTKHYLHIIGCKKNHRFFSNTFLFSLSCHWIKCFYLLFCIFRHEATSTLYFVRPTVLSVRCDRVRSQEHFNLYVINHNIFSGKASSIVLNTQRIPHNR